jgi:hypothetical protein
VGITRCTDGMAKGGGGTAAGRVGPSKEWWGRLKGRARVGRVQGWMPSQGGGLSQRSRAVRWRRGLGVKQGCGLTHGPRLVVSGREMGGWRVGHTVTWVNGQMGRRVRSAQVQPGTKERFSEI